MPSNPANHSPMKAKEDNSKSLDDKYDFISKHFKKNKHHTVSEHDTVFKHHTVSEKNTVFKHHEISEES